MISVSTNRDFSTFSYLLCFDNKSFWIAENQTEEDKISGIQAPIEKLRLKLKLPTIVFFKPNKFGYKALLRNIFDSVSGKLPIKIETNMRDIFSDLSWEISENGSEVELKYIIKKPFNFNIQNQLKFVLKPPKSALIKEINCRLSENLRKQIKITKIASNLYFCSLNKSEMSKYHRNEFYVSDKNNPDIDLMEQNRASMIDLFYHQKEMWTNRLPAMKKRQISCLVFAELTKYDIHEVIIRFQSNSQLHSGSTQSEDYDIVFKILPNLFVGLSSKQIKEAQEIQKSLSISQEKFIMAEFSNILSTVNSGTDQKSLIKFESSFDFSSNQRWENENKQLQGSIVPPKEKSPPIKNQNKYVKVDNKMSVNIENPNTLLKKKKIMLLPNKGYSQKQQVKENVKAVSTHGSDMVSARRHQEGIPVCEEPGDSIYGCVMESVGGQQDDIQICEELDDSFELQSSNNLSENKKGMSPMTPDSGILSDSKFISNFENQDESTKNILFPNPQKPMFSQTSGKPQEKGTKYDFLSSKKEDPYYKLSHVQGEPRNTDECPEIKFDKSPTISNKGKSSRGIEVTNKSPNVFKIENNQSFSIKNADSEQNISIGRNVVFTDNVPKEQMSQESNTRQESVKYVKIEEAGAESESACKKSKLPVIETGDKSMFESNIPQGSEENSVKIKEFQDLSFRDGKNKVNKNLSVEKNVTVTLSDPQQRTNCLKKSKVNFVEVCEIDGKDTEGMDASFHKNELSFIYEKNICINSESLGKLTPEKGNSDDSHAKEDKVQSTTTESKGLKDLSSAKSRDLCHRQPENVKLQEQNDPNLRQNENTQNTCNSAEPVIFTKGDGFHKPKITKNRRLDERLDRSVDRKNEPHNYQDYAQNPSSKAYNPTHFEDSTTEQKGPGYTPQQSERLKDNMLHDEKFGTRERPYEKEDPRTKDFSETRPWKTEVAGNNTFESLNGPRTNLHDNLTSPHEYRKEKLCYSFKNAENNSTTGNNEPRGFSNNYQTEPNYYKTYENVINQNRMRPRDYPNYDGQTECDYSKPEYTSIPYSKYDEPSDYKNMGDLIEPRGRLPNYRFNQNYSRLAEPSVYKRYNDLTRRPIYSSHDNLNDKFMKSRYLDSRGISEVGDHRNYYSHEPTRRYNTYSSNDRYENRVIPYHSDVNYHYYNHNTTVETVRPRTTLNHRRVNSLASRLDIAESKIRRIESCIDLLEYKIQSVKLDMYKKSMSSTERLAQLTKEEDILDDDEYEEHLHYRRGILTRYCIMPADRNTLRTLIRSEAANQNAINTLKRIHRFRFLDNY